MTSPYTGTRGTSQFVLCHTSDQVIDEEAINMVILKNIPRILSPELISVLARMGHGDEIVLADANFPSASVAKAGPELVRKPFL